jgi:hypothetical protein
MTRKNGAGTVALIVGSGVAGVNSISDAPHGEPAFVCPAGTNIAPINPSSFRTAVWNSFAVQQRGSAPVRFHRL